MAWSTLAANQMVSFTDAQEGGFTLNGGQSHVTSTQCMTKNDALTKYNLVASNMSSYTNTQLVPKSAWVNGLGNMWTINSYTDPNLSFTRNYGADASVTVQTSVNNGSTWTDTTGSATSPRNIGSYATGTWIRLKSTSNGSLSNTYVVPSVTNIFSGNVTVAKLTLGSTDFWGYLKSMFGTISNDSMTMNARTTTLYGAYYNDETDYIIVEFNNTSSSIVANGWNKITIAGLSYDRIAFNAVYFDSSNQTWVYELPSATNPFGITVGAVKAITIN